MVARALVAEFIKGSESGVGINLVGGQNLMILGDKVKMEVDFATNMGIQWHNSLVGEQCGDLVRMVNIDSFWTKSFRIN